ncbi:pol protein [Cucumis melo var. makuwa]|uniref:Pol protein n=1 Tax=Cucumis melo var. makuwa TaxID=1194695 RepID=A0A5A7UZL9_CUCMM|nr:pol protein [Cucumis melo var. makuwa]
MLGFELVQTTNAAIEKIRARMLIAHSKQKSYADERHKDLEFYARDMVFLKVAPMKDVLRFEKKGKFAPVCVVSRTCMRREPRLSAPRAEPIPSLQVESVRTRLAELIRLPLSRQSAPVPFHLLCIPLRNVVDQLTWSVGFLQQGQALQPRSWDLRRLGKRVVTVRTCRANLQVSFGITTYLGLCGPTGRQSSMDIDMIRDIEDQIFIPTGAHVARVRERARDWVEAEVEAKASWRATRIITSAQYKELSCYRKLNPRFVRSFEILERIDPIAYCLVLPLSFSTIHDAFHVSMLRKYVADPTHIIDFGPLQINENLSYEEQPVEILAREVKMVHNRGTTLVKVLWRNHEVEEATWERGDDMRAQYPALFED